jgi:hypothetical protein
MNPPNTVGFASLASKLNFKELNDYTDDLRVFWSKLSVQGFVPEVRTFATLTKVGGSYFLFGG